MKAETNIRYTIKTVTTIVSQFNGIGLRVFNIAIPPNRNEKNEKIILWDRVQITVSYKILASNEKGSANKKSKNDVLCFRPVILPTPLFI